MRARWMLPGVFLLALVLAGGCKKEAKNTVVAPPAAVSVPDSVLGVAEMPRGARFLELGRGLTRLSPQAGSGASLGLAAGVSQAVGVLVDKPANVDIEAPMYLIWVDPAVHDPPFVWVGKATAGKKLAARDETKSVRAEGDTLIAGPTTAVTAYLDYAQFLARTPAKRQRAILYPAALVEAFRTDLDDAAALFDEAQSEPDAGFPDLRQIARVYVDVARAAGEQVARIEIYPTDSDPVHVAMDFVAREGTNFGKFIADQSATDFALLGRLPPREKTTMLMAGHVRLGALRQAFIDFTRASITVKDMDSYVATLEEAFDAFNGRWAAAITLGVNMEPPGEEPPGLSSQMQLETSVLAGIENPQAAGPLLQKLFTLMATGQGIQTFGVKQSVEFTPDVARYKEANILRQISRTSVDEEILFSQTQYMAVVDDVLVVTQTLEDKPRISTIETAIDAARGEGDTLVLDSWLEEALQVARADKASFFWLVNVSSVLPADGSVPMKMGNVAGHLSFPDDTMRWTSTFWPVE